MESVHTNDRLTPHQRIGLSRGCRDVPVERLEGGEGGEGGEDGEDGGAGEAGEAGEAGGDGEGGELFGFVNNPMMGIVN